MILKDAFVAALEQCPGFDSKAFIDAHNSPPSVSFRVNPSKCISGVGNSVSHSGQTVLASVHAQDQVPWCKEGFYLKDRPVFTLDPNIHAGAYYVQEASSMFIDHALRSVLNERKELKALDLCAAPGGKSTLLANLPQVKLLLANEIIQSRVSILYENIVKWGNDHVFVSNNDPREIGKLHGFFDLILVDAPCSGSGLFRKDPSAMGPWNNDLVSFCSVRQKRILEDIYPSLAENGILLYSTCSFSTEENESNVDSLLSNYGLESLRIPVPDEWGVVETASPQKGGYGYRFYPDKVKGEGFFCALFIKKETVVSSEVRPKRSHSIYRSDQLLHFLQNPANHVCYQHEKDVFAVETACYDDFTLLQDHLSIKRSGLRVGSLVRDELLPDHELAMSISQNISLPSIEVDLNRALKFLRKMDMGIEATEKGWMLVKYNGISLGWVKSIPRRMNNYYPMHWRILMQE